MKHKLILLPKAQRVLNDLGENIKLSRLRGMHMNSPKHVIEYQGEIVYFCCDGLKLNLKRILGDMLKRLRKIKRCKNSFGGIYRL